jgi:hypothetical protein
MRLTAIQADLLLRRRHPDLSQEPLRSAEPEPLPDELHEPTLEAGLRRAVVVTGSLAAVQTELDNRAGLLVPAEDPDYDSDGGAWPDLRRPHNDAVLQPPSAGLPALHRQPELEHELQA